MPLLSQYRQLVHLLAPLLTSDVGPSPVESEATASVACSYESAMHGAPAHELVLSRSGIAPFLQSRLVLRNYQSCATPTTSHVRYAVAVFGKELGLEWFASRERNGFSGPRPQKPVSSNASMMTNVVFCPKRE